MNQPNDGNGAGSEKHEEETIDKVARALIAIARGIVRKEKEENKKTA